MGSWFDGKYSQRGNKYLTIAEAYLESSRKSTIKLFCKKKLPQQIHNPKGYTEQQSNTSQVIQSDSSKYKFREALVTPEIGLFHGIRLFYPRNPESYATFRL